MNVVIYARFSSHSQTEQSIEGQLKTCYEFARKQGYTVIAEYIDRALSGTTDNRPQFLKMIEDSNKKHFDGVLVYQLDRFARNRYDSATYKAKLKKNGVRVYSARENITDDASGILVEGLLESMAEYYSAELSQKIRRGMDINAEKCLCTGGNIALGYKVIDKQFYVDEATAPIVQRVFELYANGKTVTEICDILNAEGIKTSRGVAFNKNSLRTILKNKRYIGIYTYKEKEIPDGIPRIIDDDLFYKVARIMETNKKAPAKAKAKEEYLLTTKLFCGHCKEMMRGYGGTGKLGKHYHYYACNGRIKKVCDKKSVDKEYIENLVIAECRKLLTDENIDKIAREVVALCEREQDNTNYKRLQKLLKENTRKQENVASAIVECDNEGVRKLMYEQVAKIQTERAELEKQLALEKASQVHLSVSDIKFFLKQLKKGKADDIRYRKTLINVFINAIYLYDDKITFIFNSGDKPITIDDKLLSDIEADNKAFECSFLEQVAPPNKRAERLFFVWWGIEMGIESPCLCRYDRQKHSGGVFLGRSAAVADNMGDRNDRERQNAFWRNRTTAPCPTASTQNKQLQIPLMCDIIRVYMEKLRKTRILCRAWEGYALRKFFIVLLALGVLCSVLGGCQTVSDIPVSGTEDTTPAPPVSDSVPDSVSEEPEVPPIDLHAVIGKTDYALRTSDPRSGQTILFRAQTNLGNLCADAYRSATGADAAIVCAAEIGADMDAGEITVGDVFDVFPEECALITVQATGAEILDCLEIVYRHHPADTPDYAHVSGITLLLDENTPTPVQTDEVDRIVGISGPRRVGNVQIGGVDLDESATYTLTFSPYIASPLAEVFKDAPTVSGEPLSNRTALSSHISDVLGGVIGEEYLHPFGDQRVRTIPRGQTEIPAPSGILPQVYLTTDETIDRLEYVSCSITVHDPSGVYGDIYDGESTVKIRGNSTSVGKKAPYNIKFSEKVDLLGLGRGKKWCLLANMYDKTQLRNTLAYSFAQAIGMEYTSKSCLAEVYLNGEYRGMYQICEPVDTGKTQVDIDTDNNEYLMELEPYRGYSNPACLITPVFQMILGYNEPEAPTAEQRAWLKDFMTGAENALLSGDYEQVTAYVDVDSFARCYITQELFKNIDYLVSSTRFYIKGNKLYEGPVWDFDLSSGNCSKSYYPEYNNADTTGLSYEGLHCVGLFNQYLFAYTEFRDLVAKLYTEYQPLIVNLYRDNEMGQNRIDALVTEHREGIDRNNALWPTKTASSLYEHRPIDGTYDGEIAYLKDWLEKRNAWLWEYYCTGN